MTTLLAPGTLSINIPQFTAPLFTAARVAVGNAVTMIRLAGVGDNLPFTFGQPFVEGDLVPGDALIGRTVAGEIALQVNVKATHPDGSIRHAIISGVIPKLEKLRDVWLVRAKRQAASAPIPHSDPSIYRATLVENGVVYTATPSAAANRQQWLTGPIASESIYNGPFVDAAGVPHKMLTAQFAVRDYANNTKVDITTEYSKAYETNGLFYPKPVEGKPIPAPLPAQVDIKYDATHRVGTTPRHSELALTHFPGARWKKTYWLNETPDLHVQHFTPYLIESKAIAPYDQRVKVEESYIQTLYAKFLGPDFAPMRRGRFEAYMPAAGGRSEIGLMPDSYAAYILSMDRRVYQAMLGSADAGGSWSTHYRDHTGKPLDVAHWPYATIKGNPGDSINRTTGQMEKLPIVVTSSPLTADSDHQPAFAYLPYLLTGDFYYMEEMKFWTHWNIYSANCAYRGYAKAIMSVGQVRGQAWTLRGMAECAAFVPDDDPSKAHFNYWLGNTADHFAADYATPGARLYSPVGATITGTAIVYNNGTHIAPWQDHFQMAAFGYAHELTGLPALKKVAEWKAQFVIGCMSNPAFCWTDSAAYTLSMRGLPGGLTWTTFDQIYKASFPAARLETACGSPERLAYLNSIRGAQTNPIVQNEMTGFPGSETGFPSNMQPALAYAVDITGDRSAAATSWNRYDTRANQPKYGNGPQFALVPRTYAAAVVLPAMPKETRAIELYGEEWALIDQRGMPWVIDLLKLID